MGAVQGEVGGAAHCRHPAPRALQQQRASAVTASKATSDKSEVTCPSGDGGSLGGTVGEEIQQPQVYILILLKFTILGGSLWSVHLFTNTIPITQTSK